MTYLLSIFRKDLLAERLKKIQEGDVEERERLIQDYIPFIIKTVSNVTNRYIESENSEEYSIGLEAFNEAINKYQFSRGNFLSFAGLVIKSRITDYMRKQKKQSMMISICQIEEQDYQKMKNSIENQEFTESIILKAEINAFKSKLNNFGITLCDLVRESPKHRNTRIKALRTARYISDHSLIKEELFRKKRLPYGKIIQDMEVSRKFLDRSKRFIIAAVLILDSDLDILKAYIYDVERGSINDI